MTEEYIDLLVTDDDLTLGSLGEPIYLDGRASIAQDIRHMIRESGLLVKMIGERDPEAINMGLVLIESEMEKDTRLVPGTAQAVRVSPDVFYVLADTEQYGKDLRVDL